MDELTSLSLRNLHALPATIATPRYRREAVTPGLVHFGVGNFHRAHMAVYLDALMNRGEALDWGIVGAGVTPHDRTIFETLRKQDFLTTVIERDADNVTAKVTGAMIDFVDPSDGDALLRQLADPAIRVVSLTITEGGYFLDAQGGFDAGHAAIRADATHPDAPGTVFGLLLKALRARRASGVASFTILSCDNIPHNGAVTRAALVGLAELSDPAFAQWVTTNVATPNSMVDRITPATGETERTEFRETFGYVDGWPVFCEPFTQWVLEDRFPSGRPPFELVGATFVKDVLPFELMKLRVLNGGHAAIAYPAGIMGIHYVHEAMEHPLVSGFLDKVEREEIIPVTSPPPGVDLLAYLRVVQHRFANPKVGDTVRRLCLDGSNRQPKFIIPSIADALTQGKAFTGLALESAMWCRYCYGETEKGEAIAPNDPNWDRLTEVAARAKANPGEWLAMRDIYGAVGDDGAFAASFAAALNKLWRVGVEKTLSDWIEGRGLA